ncbi:hypothetical protein ASZ90_017522 [hydrocarbon metagenome]|uniref:Uncharacterized protein n=1 Tax=hydrocarbon metagenome TaxID=938273 RepID=A0A0W8E8Y3_9ZZZZ
MDNINCLSITSRGTAPIHIRAQWRSRGVRAARPLPLIAFAGCCYPCFANGRQYIYTYPGASFGTFSVVSTVPLSSYSAFQ